MHLSARLLCGKDMKISGSRPMSCSLLGATGGEKW